MKNPYKYMKMHWEDFEIETAGITLEERGAYTALMSLYWRSSGEAIRADDARISRLLGITMDKWLELKPTVSQFFYKDGDFWRHKMMSDLFQECRASTEKQRRNANKRWAANESSADHVVIPMRKDEQEDYPF